MKKAGCHPIPMRRPFAFIKHKRYIQFMNDEVKQEASDAFNSDDATAEVTGQYLDEFTPTPPVSPLPADSMVVDEAQDLPDEVLAAVPTGDAIVSTPAADMGAEAKSVSELKDADYNPRSMSREEFELLKKSMVEQGDLSSVIRNRTTGNLVGGHRRKDAVLELVKRGLPVNLEITERLDSPNSAGTIARGYIVVGDEKFPYREVVWDLDWEMAANIAANAISGDFDDQALAQLTYQLNQVSEDLVNMTGQTDAEIKALLKAVSGEGDDPNADDRPPRFEVVIECENTDIQQAVYDQLIAQGLKCRLQG